VYQRSYFFIFKIAREKHTTAHPRGFLFLFESLAIGFTFRILFELFDKVTIFRLQQPC